MKPRPFDGVYLSTKIHTLEKVRKENFPIQQVVLPEAIDDTIQIDNQVLIQCSLFYRRGVSHTLVVLIFFASAYFAGVSKDTTLWSNST